MLHEMAHAWASHYMTNAHRQAFRNVRHWKYWLDDQKAESTTWLPTIGHESLRGQRGRQQFAAKVDEFR